MVQRESLLDRKKRRPFFMFKKRKITFVKFYSSFLSIPQSFLENLHSSILKRRKKKKRREIIFFEYKFNVEYRDFFFLT
jgi:hypothetical protein